MADDEDMAGSSAGEGGSPGAAKKRVQRKPKRRTMDAHFWGMSDVEIAAIKASLAAEAGDDGSDGGKDATTNDEDRQQDGAEEQEEQAEQVEEVPEGQLSKEEIQERRKILHTDWRMAAFSQFAHCFPHLCIKEFSIEKLERDLEGTEPGSYVGEVISRLLYHLTKDSALAGKSPDKPWLIRLRREFLRRDPSHNSLGDGPLYVSGGDFYDDEEEEQTALNNLQSDNHTPYTGEGTPAVDQSAALAVQPPPADTITVQASEDNADVKLKTEENDQTTAMDITESSDAVKDVKEEEEKPAWLAEFPNSKGWEDLSLHEQIYALWAVTEWHLTNADKFRNILVKYRIEPEQPFWRIEPIGYDKDYNVYWMFDDFRLWIERQTPVRRQQLILLEETAERLKEREKARQKRIRHEQRMRMKALHDRRRERIAAKKAAEQALDQEIEAMDEMDRKKAQEASTNGKSSGKRKRATVQEPEEDEQDDDFAAEEEEEEEPQSTRVSSRISRARKTDSASTPSSRPNRRRSTRNSSVGNMTALQGGGSAEEEWQKIPAEWMRSEEEERDEDPDFGAEQQENGAESENDDDSELSLLDEDEDEVAKASRRSGRRASQRSRRTSPRKSRESRVKAESKNDSELSDLSDVEGMSLDEAEDAEEEEGDEKIDLSEPVGYYPDSAWESYKAVPSFDDEDKDQPEGFVHWELLIKELPEWLEFTEKYFPNTEDSRELALVSWVDEQVVPKAQAELERREEVRKKEEAARKAAERKARLEKEKAAAAAGASPAPGSLPPGRTFRSSRIAQKEAKEAEERAKALAEERLRPRDPNDQSVLDLGEEGSESQADVKIVERDRRAARAKEREDAKRAREEAELIAALEEAEGGPSEDQPAKAIQSSEQSAMQVDSVVPVPIAASMPPVPMPQSGPPSGAISMQPALATTTTEAAQVAPSAEPEYFDDGGAEDYFLDCSVCKKRGLNLDPNSRLVACDNCDRWEHVVCHRKADERAGRPKRDWDNDPFLCEDCEDLEESVIVPTAPKRERSEKQKAGARKGAEKRKAKAAADRAKKAAANPKAKPVQGAASIPATASPASSAQNGEKPATPSVVIQSQGTSGMHIAQQGQRSPALQMPPQSGASYQQMPQVSRSPYHPGGPGPSPSVPPYGNMPSPSLQAHHQRYPSQAYQQPQFQGQQQMQQQSMPSQGHPSQSIPSPHYMPQQQQQQPPQYAMQQQQHAFQGNAPAYQGNFAPQGAFAGGPASQMYPQQGAQGAFVGGMNPMQQQQQQQQRQQQMLPQHGQGVYQTGYSNLAYAGPPNSAFAPPQMPQGGFTMPQQHHQQQQQQQQQGQPFLQGGMGMAGHLANPAQQRSSQGPQ